MRLCCLTLTSSIIQLFSLDKHFFFLPLKQGYCEQWGLICFTWSYITKEVNTVIKAVFFSLKSMFIGNIVKYLLERAMPSPHSPWLAELQRGWWPHPVTLALMLVSVTYKSFNPTPHLPCTRSNATAMLYNVRLLFLLSQPLTWISTCEWNLLL